MQKTNMTETRRKRRNAETNAFLTSMNKGRLTLAHLLSALREGEGETLASFAERIGVSRQHLHQVETGAKRVSPERAVRFARLLGQSETLFLQLVLQDLADDSGIAANVEIKVA
jgi:transcriptional regulator with XRE-family HTH domain